MAWWMAERGRLACKMKQLHVHRMARQFAESDAIRDEVLAMDPGFRVLLAPNRAVLESWPHPLFSIYPFDHLNFAVVVADSTKED